MPGVYDASLQFAEGVGQVAKGYQDFKESESQIAVRRQAVEASRIRNRLMRQEEQDAARSRELDETQRAADAQARIARVDLLRQRALGQSAGADPSALDMAGKAGQAVGGAIGGAIGNVIQYGGNRMSSEAKRINKINARFGEFQKIVKDMSPGAAEILFQDLKKDADSEILDINYGQLAQNLSGMRTEAFMPDGTPLPHAGELKELEQAIGERSLPPDKIAEMMNELGDALDDDRSNFMEHKRGVDEMARRLQPENLPSYLSKEERKQANSLFSRFQRKLDMDPEHALQELDEILSRGSTRYARAIDIAKELYGDEWKDMNAAQKRGAIAEVGRERFRGDPQFLPVMVNPDYDPLYNSTVGAAKSAPASQNQNGQSKGTSTGAPQTGTGVQRVASFTSEQWGGLEKELSEAVRSGADVTEIAVKWGLSPTMSELMTTERGRELVKAVTFNAPRPEGAAYQPPSAMDIGGEEDKNFGDEHPDVVQAAEMLHAGLDEGTVKEELLSRFSPFKLPKQLLDQVIGAVMKRSKTMAARPEYLRSIEERETMQDSESLRETQEETRGVPPSGEEQRAMQTGEGMERATDGPKGESRAPGDPNQARTALRGERPGLFDKATLKSWKQLDGDAQDTLWMQLVQAAQKKDAKARVGEDFKPILRAAGVNIGTVPAQLMRELRKMRRKAKGGE